MHVLSFYLSNHTVKKSKYRVNKKISTMQGTFLSLQVSVASQTFFKFMKKLFFVGKFWWKMKIITLTVSEQWTFLIRRYCPDAMINQTSIWSSLQLSKRCWRSWSIDISQMTHRKKSKSDHQDRQKNISTACAERVWLRRCIALGGNQVDGSAGGVWNLQRLTIGETGASWPLFFCTSHRRHV